MAAIPLLGGGTAYAAGPDPQGTVYVANEGPNAIDVFAPGSAGNVAPERVIEGVDTGIDVPGDVKVDAAGDVWVSDFGDDSITEYAPGASGDAAPICTISGSNTGLDENDDMSVEADGTLVVGNFANAAATGGSVLVFAPGSCGNVTPEETIAGANAGFNTVDGVGTDAAGTIFADSSENKSIEAFPPGTNGNAAPEFSISGSNTGLGFPDDIIVGFNGELYATNGFGGPVNSVTVFAPGATGNATPIQDITGSNTDFGLPDDLAVDTSGEIYVSDSEATVGPAVLEFAPGATGNVAPAATITGSATTLDIPEGVAVAGPPATVGAKVTTSVSAATISLGGATSDTATFTGGTVAPTGSLVFKLFGPGDPTCSAAPAFTSSAQTVNGDGNYASLSFKPTATGAYSWQALYSGDANNPPVTTACNDPAETVTVGAVTGKAPVVDTYCYEESTTSVLDSLTTTKNNELLVDYVSAAGPSTGGQGVTVSGSGLTWTKVAQENGAPGDTEVWTATVPAAGTTVNITAAATATGYHIVQTLVAYKNAAGIGATGAFTSTSGAPTGTITTTAGNSWVWAAGFDASHAKKRTVGTGQDIYKQDVDSAADGTSWVQRTQAATPAAGTAVTINDTAPATDNYNLVLIEILG